MDHKPAAFTLPQAEALAGILQQIRPEWARPAMNDAHALGRNNLGKELEDRGMKKNSRALYGGIRIRPDWEKLS
ncbi:hypothetical protein OG312_10520 [Kocuria rhizophila]|uniref:hypothetical protein n=1 Tax=Kocuria rhizophila TaxID=72000 RepID=UPI0028AAEC5F|nr:hypothetical protein [Kocuria rhizophila]WSQ04826.1 hypothetical protein OG312_10520 [Kocuria rhizophila]